MRTTLPKFLQQLIENFENTEEAKKFLVTPPPKPGSVYQFTEPYLYLGGDVFTTEQASAELHLLVMVLCNALNLFLVQRLAESSDSTLPERLTQLEQGNFGMPIINGNPVNPRRVLGWKTKMGLFPVADIEELLKQVNARKLQTGHAGVADLTSRSRKLSQSPFTEEEKLGRRGS